MTINTAEKTMIQNSAASFDPSSITVEGMTYPAKYTVDPSGVVAILVTISSESGDQLARIIVNPCETYYTEALTAAKGGKRARKAAKAEQAADAQQAEQATAEAQKPERPAKRARKAAKPEQTAQEAQQAKQPTAEAQQPEQPAAEAQQPEQPAQPVDPAKQARGPIPEKTFAGTSIDGNGWRILFDSATQRTRLIFAETPSDAQRAAAQEAGFYWSAPMSSYNKKLTFRAYRAAQELAKKLAAM